MSHRRWSTVTTVAGLFLSTCSVLMAFLADHHWLVGYQSMLFLKKTIVPVQLAGLLLLVTGSVWVAVTQEPRRDVQMGSAFCAVALLLPLTFGGYSAILNVHSWTFVLVPPMLLLASSGALLAIIGLEEAVHRRES